jgi:hypothetical protein
MKNVLTRSLEFASKNVMYVFLGILVALGLLSFAIESLKTKENANSSAPTICPINQELCGGKCTFLDSDRMNCGSCGYRCWDQFNIYSQCAAGTCVCPSNLPATCTDQNFINYCANTDTDSRNCGACGIACNLGESCVNGMCS